MEIKRKIYLTSAVIIACFVASICVLLPLLVNQIKRASDDLLVSKKALAEIQIEQQNILSKKRDYQAIKSEIDVITSGFLARGRAVDFIVALEKIAQASGNRYEIQVLESQQKRENSDEDEKKTEKSQELTFINFQITLMGNFPRLLNFLARLDNLSYLNDIENIQIQRINQDSVERGEKEGDVSSIIQIRAYLNPNNN